MPVVFFRATDFGVSGNETHLELNQNKKLIDEMGEIRIELGKRIGFGDVSKSVIPKVALISKPTKAVLNLDILWLGAAQWLCYYRFNLLTSGFKIKGTVCSDFYSDYSTRKI